MHLPHCFEERNKLHQIFYTLLSTLWSSQATPSQAFTPPTDENSTSQWLFCRLTDLIPLWLLHTHPYQTRQPNGTTKWFCWSQRVSRQLLSPYVIRTHDSSTFWTAKSFKSIWMLENLVWHRGRTCISLNVQSHVIWLQIAFPTSG